MSRIDAPQGLKHVMSSALMRSDKFLDHLSRILATSSGRDTLLQTLQYTLLVVHSQLARLRDWQLKRLVIALASKASATLLPGETVVARVVSPTARLDNVIASTKTLSGLISDFRIFTRLWGLLGIYSWAKSTWHDPPSDPVIRATTWVQVLAGAGFQWYENLAYLAMKGVLRGERFGERQQAKWWEWSSRYWMLHVALEGVRLAREWQLEAAAVETTDVDDHAGEKSRKTEAVNVWRRSLLVNVAWAPITAHYSWEQGCLSDQWVGLFGIVACGPNFWQLWKRTS